MGPPSRERKARRLTVDLVPATSWCENLRTRLAPSQWDTLRRATYRAAYYRCEVCGGRGETHPVECHEQWDFDDEHHVQRLARLIALCPSCHEVKHIGHSRLSGRDVAARHHLAKVNRWTGAEVDGHISKALRVWERRSRHPWTLDLEILRHYDIQPPTGDRQQGETRPGGSGPSPGRREACIRGL